MTYQNILVRIEGAVGIVTLNRPQALNALNSPMMDELATAMDGFEADGAIRCVIINHKLNLAPEHSAFLVHMLFAKQVALTTVATLYRRFSTKSGRCANPDRLLGESRGRPGYSEAEAKSD